MDYIEEENIIANSLIEAYATEESEMDPLGTAQIDESADDVSYLYEIEEAENDGEIELYNCDACGMDFESIDEHVKKYHSHQDVVVDVGEESTKYIASATDEPEESTINDVTIKEEQVVYYCDVCEKEFITLRALSTHINASHGKDDDQNAEESKGKDKGKNVCNICNTVFSSAKSLKWV